jgi:CRISPR/Cas system-associated endonuclease Cas1
MDKGCVILRDKNKKEQKYPLFEAEIGEVVLTSGNMVSTGALSALGFWGMDVLIATRNGRPIAALKNLEDDSCPSSMRPQRAIRHYAPFNFF